MPFVSLIYSKHKTYVDLFLGQSEFQKSLLSRARKFKFNKGTINVVSPEDLILVKLISGREKDIEDVRDIITENLKNLNFKYLRDWAKRLNVDIFLKDELKSLRIRD
jgi:DNA polymerase elongation subunit (family B)